MIYIHIPFCRSFCIYCGFYSEICRGADSHGQRRRYVSELSDEISRRRAEISAAIAVAETDTLYIGGGTPSVLDAEDFKAIMDALGHRPEGEYTVEVNPDDIVVKGEGYVRDLLGLGVNRISMGVQSLDDGILKWMRRRHGAHDVAEAFGILRRAGVGNVSADLIFGIPMLSDRQWSDTIDKLLLLSPEHVSAYQLSVEEGSALRRAQDSGEYAEASEELCAGQYDMLCERLRNAGYRHYEISNWALPGYEARHNSAYWRRVPYVGLGAGAHSFDGCRRSWNTEQLSAYVSESETLTAEDEKVETIMLSLRTADGIDRSWLESVCEPQVLRRLLADGSLAVTGAMPSPAGDMAGRLRIPEDRFFVSDAIIRQLI